MSEQIILNIAGVNKRFGGLQACPMSACKSRKARSTA